MRFLSFRSNFESTPTLVAPQPRDWDGYSESAEDLDANVDAYWKLSYGSFWPQLGVPHLIRAKHMLRCQNIFCIGFTRNRTERLIELRRLHFFDVYTTKSGNNYYPLVALVRTALLIPPRKDAGPLHLFPCQTADSRAKQHSRISDPVGILSLKVEVKKARAAFAENPARADWLSFADTDYARTIAREIR